MVFLNFFRLVVSTVSIDKYKTTSPVHLLPITLTINSWQYFLITPKLYYYNHNTCKLKELSNKMKGLNLFSCVLCRFRKKLYWQCCFIFVLHVYETVVFYTKFTRIYLSFVLGKKYYFGHRKISFGSLKFLQLDRWRAENNNFINVLPIN